MFGYVKVFQPQLKICEYEQYKAVYCGLCRALGKRYGAAARMTLSYDFTFLALFLMALKEEPVSFEQGRCALHPLKKRPFCRQDAVLEHTADIAILLLYHKLSDTVRDEGFFKSLSARFLRWIFKKDYNRAVERCPAQAEAATAFMRAQEAVETSDAPCIDACAEPTALFLSKMFAFGDDGETVALTSRFGYCLGRFVYLADAAQDLEEDLRKGRFNPYAVQPSDGSQEWIKQRKEYAAQTLHACVGVCAECYQALSFHRFSSIISNVVFEGLPHVIRQICEKNQEETDNEKSV